MAQPPPEVLAPNRVMDVNIVSISPGCQLLDKILVDAETAERLSAMKCIEHRASIEQQDGLEPDPNPETVSPQYRELEDVV